MVVDHCTLNIQTCMIHFYVRSNTLIKMVVYHSFCHDKCTINYDHICIQLLRSILYVRLQSYQLSAIIEKGQVKIQDGCKSGIF